jgi:hypothetical protein
VGLLIKQIEKSLLMLCFFIKDMMIIPLDVGDEMGEWLVIWRRSLKVNIHSGVNFCMLKVILDIYNDRALS